MRTVIVHNYYRSDQPSGENASVDLEVAGLRRAGVDVELFSASSDSITESSAKVRLAASCLGSRSVANDFRRLLADFSPDVVHLENLYPLLSPLPGVLARAQGIPVVCSVRNFRLTCAAGTHVRNGQECSLCPDHPHAWNLPAVAHGCYRGRRSDSLPIAFAMGIYRRLLYDLDHYLPASEYMRDYLVGRVGIESSRITVRPNAGPVDKATRRPITSRRVLFAGRLSSEKGVHELLEAWRRSGPPSGWVLAIAGAGPLEPTVRAAASATASVEYSGHLAPTEMWAEYDRAAIVVIPSMWNEPFGRTAIEAFAHGRPVLACNMGALPSVVVTGTGKVVDPSVAGLAAGLRALTGLPEQKLEAMGEVSAAHYDAAFTPNANMAILTDVYRRVTPPELVGAANDTDDPTLSEDWSAT